MTAEIVNLADYKAKKVAQEAYNQLKFEATGFPLRSPIQQLQDEMQKFIVEATIILKAQGEIREFTIETTIPEDE